VKRAVLYARVSTGDQNCDTQLLDLRQLAEQRGFAITETYIDHGAGTSVASHSNSIATPSCVTATVA
jgi:DNA invertase Pin-like site-specific DNA recombinase